MRKEVVSPHEPGAAYATLGMTVEEGNMDSS
jgi:hypothetical protein